LTTLSFAVQSCTSEPVELLAPETKQRIEDKNARAICVHFIIAPDNQEVWSNLVWKEDGTWEITPLGIIYPNQSDWMSASWTPNAHLLELSIKYDVIGFSKPILQEDDSCGQTESIHTYDNGAFYKITFSMDDEFVQCLDGTGDQIKLDITILL
jgi:hypothetical protein